MKRDGRVRLEQKKTFSCGEGFLKFYFELVY